MRYLKGSDKVLATYEYAPSGDLKQIWWGRFVTDRYWSREVLDYTFEKGGRLESFQRKSWGNNFYNVANQGDYDTLYSQPLQKIDYDKIDQIIKESQAAGSTERDYTPNGSPLGPTIERNQLLRDADAEYHYDREGNLQSEISKVFGAVFSYDHLNRLIGVEQKNVYKPNPNYGQVLESRAYKYDALGNRVEENNNGVITRFAHDGPNVWAEFGTDGDIDRRFITGAIDQLFARIDNAAGTPVYFFMTDRQGSVLRLDAPNGETFAKYRYEPFGVGMDRGRQVQGFGNRYGYTARDSERAGGLQLQYNRARTYHLRIKRWLQMDPIGLVDDTNPYRYVGNSPTNFTDPSGLIADGVDLPEDRGRTNEKLGNKLLGFAKAALWDYSVTGLTVEMTAAHVEQRRTEDLAIAARARNGITSEYPRMPSGWEVAMKEGWAGLKVGTKATVNAYTDTAVSFGTLGFVDNVEVWEVTDEDRENGYNLSYGLARVGGELLLTAATLGAGKLAQAPGYLNKLAKLARAMDFAQSTVMTSRGGYDIYKNGLNWQNGLQLAGGLVGVGGQAWGEGREGSGGQ